MLWRPEANACVRVIAEGLVAGAATAAEPHVGQAVDSSPGACADLDRPGYDQRPIGLRRDEERSSSRGQRLACPRFGFAARHEADCLVAVIAKGLVLRSPAPAQRRAGDAAVTEQFNIGMRRVGPVFADAHHIDRRRLLRWAAIAPHIGDGAGRALLSDGDKTLCIDGVRVDPRSRRVGLEHSWGLQDAEAGVNAPLAVEPDRYVTAPHLLDLWPWRNRLSLGRLASGISALNGGTRRTWDGAGCGGQRRCNPRQFRPGIREVWVAGQDCGRGLRDLICALRNDPQQTRIGDWRDGARQSEGEPRGWGWRTARRWQARQLLGHGNNRVHEIDRRVVEGAA